MDDVFREFAENASEMESTIKNMNEGMKDISLTVDESAKGVAGAAEDATQLVGAISNIQRQVEKNQAISAELDGEVKRFERV